MSPGYTLGEAVEAAEQGFLQAGLSFGHGSATAYDEAAYLVLHTLHLPLYDLESVWEKQLTDAQQRAVAQVVHRRIDERIPAAYLTGEAWLGPHRFYIDDRALVPRSFIAELLEEDLSPWIADPNTVGSVLDLCTGSGCLAIIAALTFPNAEVDAADLSSDALAVAQRNVDDYALNGRVRLVESDMFAALAARKYDLIVCNPPYVTAASMAALQEEYRHEPEMALASGGDGLDHVRTLLREAPEHLHQGGLLVVEAGFNRAGVEAAFPSLPFTWAEVSAGDDIVFLLTREEL
ncbi:MAG: 50S ribosomal protein L3 N(5)-glutamine methyltransferase, partial [Betaproteobacteria bacterium]|nr:50S ribosomal protein L3 N(5)-glutamine methyltransferase [Betaproteobacteria bacterium]